MKISSFPALRSVVILLFAGACGPTSPGASATDGDTTDSTSVTGSTGMTGMTGMTGSTDPTTATSTISTTVAPGETTGIEPTAGEETATTTTGDLFPALEEACAAFCNTSLACLEPNSYPDLASCEWLCLANFDPEQPGCAAATIAYDNCLAGLACPAFNDAASGVDPGECASEIAALEPACPLVCYRVVSSGNPTACTMSRACPGELPAIFECEGDTCSCKVGDEVQTKCDAAGICGEGWEAQAGAANVCCGFDF